MSSFVVQHPAAFGFGAARQNTHVQAHGVGEGFQAIVVLVGEDFGGGHHTGLGTVVDGQEHGNKRHDGLAAAHIALQQPVHLPPRKAVFMNLAQHPLLRPRERKR